MTTTAGDLPALAARIAEQARLLGADAAVAGEHEARPALAVVRAASTVAELAGSALRVSVEQARQSGHTWQEIGDLLGVSRQAAFQRFGRPADPRTGETMSNAVLPGAGPRAQT